MAGDGATATLADFIADLERRQVRLRVDGGQLRCSAPSGVLTEPLLERIRDAKPEIIRHLGERELLPAVDRSGPLPSSSTPSSAPSSALPFPLSFAQEQLWLAGHLDPDSSAYHIPLAVRLTGELRPLALHRALAGVVHRHEALRTRFPLRQGRPCQVIVPADLPMRFVDLSGLPVAAQARVAGGLAAAEARRPFDLATGPVLRATLLRLAADEHRLLLTRHHIASDGWSFGVLATELSALYRACLDGRPDPLPPLPRQYADYAAWQRSTADDSGGRLDGWVRRLDGAPPGLDLVDPGWSARPSVEPVATLRRDLSGAAADAVRDTAMRASSTVFSVLLAAFGLAVASAAGQREVVVGSPASGRSRPELAPLIGCFATVLPLRLRPAEAETFGAAVRAVHDTVTEALASQDVPLERIADGLRALARGRGLAWRRSPLFEVAFAYQNTPGGEVDLPGVEVELDEPAPVAAKYPLTVTVTGRRVLAEYDPGALDGQAVADVLDRFLAVLHTGCTQPDLSPAELARRAAPGRVLITKSRRMVDGGAPEATTSRRMAGARTLGAAFAEVVGRAPDAVAVSQDGVQLSYRALDRRARRLAGALLAAGVGTESPVALCVPHTPELVTAVLGVTMAGACYVPVDPEDPPARRETVMTGAGAVALVTLARHAEDFAWFDGPVVCADRPSDWPSTPSTLAAPSTAAALSTPAGRAVHPDNLAYVIHTSGSTGAPKGVMVSHAGVTALLAATDTIYHFTPDDVWSLTHSSAFDFSVWELWGALLTGARVTVVPRTVARDPDALAWVLRDEQVTVYSTTPGAFHTLAAAVLEAEEAARTAVRTVIFGGERCDPSRLADWFEAYGDQRPRLVNMYGITETTVHVTARPLTSADTDAPHSPIGPALPGVSIDVVDRSGAPTTVGGQGELLVGGSGVARGYLRQPGLTADRFRPDHLGGTPGARLYRSGDLGRRLPGGDIGYLGRLDQQLKVRGYRIEPGEVEAALAAHPDIAAAAVAPDDDGDSLVGYLVPSGSTAPTARELRRYLTDWLPSYLVPSSYVLLEHLPLTRNGKLDHAALRTLSGAAPPVQNAPPQTPTELALAALWCELLGVDEVGVHDDFFDLGGDSLLVTRLHARLPGVFGVELPMRRIYQAGDIAAQADEIDALLSNHHGETEERPA